MNTNPSFNTNPSGFFDAATAAGFVASGQSCTRTGAAGALGTNANLSTTTTTRKMSETRMVARSERYRLQKKAQEILWNEGVKAGLEYPANHHKTIKCLRVRVGDQVDIHQSREHGGAFYGGGLVTCGKPGCPVCSAKIQERRRTEIAQAFDWAYGTAGKKVVMVTLTFSHSRDQRLADLLGLQAQALAALRRDNRWKRFKDRIGYTGMIRSLEVTHGKNGWHPHTHEAWIVDRDTDVKQLTEFVTGRWLQICSKLGLCPEGKEKSFIRRSVDVVDECRASDYLAKSDETGRWGVDRELAKSSTKKGRKAGRSVFQLLADGADGCKKSDQLYVEFVEAIRGRPIIRWSQGLKAACGVDDLTDEQLAAAQEDKADLLALLSPEDWRCVLAHDARAYVLELAETGGLPALRRWLSAPEIPKKEADMKFVEEKDQTDGMTYSEMCDLWRYKTGEVELTTAPDGRVAVLDYTDLETYIFQPKKEVEAMKTYQEFCEHYGYDVDSEQARDEYEEYEKALDALTPKPAPKPAPVKGPDRSGPGL